MEELVFFIGILLLVAVLSSVAAVLFSFSRKKGLKIMAALFTLVSLLFGTVFIIGSDSNTNMVVIGGFFLVSAVFAATNIMLRVRK